LAGRDALAGCEPRTAEATFFTGRACTVWGVQGRYFIPILLLVAIMVVAVVNPAADGRLSVGLAISARSLNPNETAELVVGCLETGRVQNLRGDPIRITPLATVLETMVSEGAYEGIGLEAGAAASVISLSGAGAGEVARR
jgi:hypothetical protein